MTLHMQTEFNINLPELFLDLNLLGCPTRVVFFSVILELYYLD